MAKSKNKRLVIVESPAKARTLSTILGDEYDVRASVGHVRDLPKSKLGVDVENDFEPRYIVPKEKKEVVKALVEASKQAQTVYLATDPDRAGEAGGSRRGVIRRASSRAAGREESRDQQWRARRAGRRRPSPRGIRGVRREAEATGTASVAAIHHQHAAAGGFAALRIQREADN